MVSNMVSRHDLISSARERVNTYTSTPSSDDEKLIPCMTALIDWWGRGFACRYKDLHFSGVGKLQ